MFLFSFPPLPICCCCQLCFLSARVSNLSLAIQFTAVFLLLVFSTSQRNTLCFSALWTFFENLSKRCLCSVYTAHVHLCHVLHLAAAPQSSAVICEQQRHWACAEVPWWSSEGLASLLGFIYDLAFGHEVLQTLFLHRRRCFLFSYCLTCCSVQKSRMS